MDKDRIYAEFARIGKAFASPARLEILDLLAQGEKSVESVASNTRLGVKNASAHLRELREASMVSSRKDGTYVYYRLADEGVFHLLRDLQAMGRQRLAEVDRIARLYFDARDQLEPISPDELRVRLEGGEVILLDVRPADEYRAGHLPGAISVPPHQLREAIQGLPRGREVVAYCRGPYCVYAADAVRALRDAGYQARRLEEGVPDWRARGLPVEVGA